MNPADIFYPGLRMYLVFRRLESGLVISVMDRNVSETEPILECAGNITFINEITNMKPWTSFTLPALSNDELKNFVENNILPSGYSTQLFRWGDEC